MSRLNNSMTRALIMVLTTLLNHVESASPNHKYGVVISVYHGDKDIILQCRGYSDYNVSVDWRRNGDYRRTFMSEDCSGDQNSCSSYLQITDAPEDYGVYVCDLRANGVYVTTTNNIVHVDSEMFAVSGPESLTEKDKKSSGSLNAILLYIAIAVAVIGWLIAAILLCRQQKYRTPKVLNLRKRSGMLELQQIPGVCIDKLQVVDVPQGITQRNSNQYSEVFKFNNLKGSLDRNERRPDSGYGTGHRQYSTLPTKEENTTRIPLHSTIKPTNPQQHQASTLPTSNSRKYSRKPSVQSALLPSSNNASYGHATTHSLTHANTNNHDASGEHLYANMELEGADAQRPPPVGHMLENWRRPSYDDGFN